MGKCSGCGVCLFDISDMPSSLRWYEHINCGGKCPLCASGQSYPRQVIVWLVSSGRVTAVQVGHIIANHPDQSIPHIDALLRRMDTFPNRQRIRARRRIQKMGVTPSGIPLWSDEERQFLRDNWGKLSRREIAVRLKRRSTTAVCVYAKREGLGGSLDLDGKLTSGQVKHILGKNDHRTITKMIARGILPGFQLSGADRSYMAVDAYQFKRWLINWRNWIYFEVNAMPDGRYKRLVQMAQERWGDAWWTTGQVAAYHHLASSKSVYNQILSGRLPGARWQNWMVRRSDAIQADFRMATDDRFNWSSRGDEYLALAAAVGIPPARIAANMGWDNDKRVFYRLRALIDQDALPVCVQRREEMVFADWREHREQFPGLARTISAFVENRPIDDIGLGHVRSVLRQWALWYAPGSGPATSLHVAIMRPETLREKWLELCAMGIDPLTTTNYIV